MGGAGEKVSVGEVCWCTGRRAGSWEGVRGVSYFQWRAIHWILMTSNRTFQLHNAES